MWPYTPDEQIWLAPSKEWTASVIVAELATRNAPGWDDGQLPLPLPMPAPYDDFVPSDDSTSDPQIMLRK